MSIMVTQSRQKVKADFTTTSEVIPMMLAPRERVRPQIIRCPECSGTRIETVMADDGNVYDYPCLFCNGQGYVVRNASHAEHRSLLERLAGWGWKALMAVIL